MISKYATTHKGNSNIWTTYISILKKKESFAALLFIPHWVLKRNSLITVRKFMFLNTAP